MSKINNFTIYAERHCGTNFLQSLIINSYNIQVTYNFGWKHFFGFHNKEIMRSGQQTLFICISRDPFQWIYAMFKKPHHMTNETNFIQFLTRPIFSYQIKDGKLLLDKEIIFEKNIYTLDRYKNIFEMRNIKYKYLLYQLPKIAPNYIFIKYEDICNNISYLEYLLHKKYMLKPKKKLENTFNRQQYIFDIDIKTCDLICSNLDETLENNMGYYL